jgi:hypothetical protein
MATTTPAMQPPVKPTRALVRRRVIQLGLFVAVQAAVLLGGSGRPSWTRAWVYLAGYVGLIALTAAVVRNPELFAERARVRKDAKTWDKLLSVFFGIFGPRGPDPARGAAGVPRLRRPGATPAAAGRGVSGLSLSAQE